MRYLKLIAPAVVFATALTTLPATDASALTLQQINGQLATLRARLNRVGDELEIAGERLTIANRAVAQHAKELQDATMRMGQIRTSLSARAALLYMMGTDPFMMSNQSNVGAALDQMAYLEQLGNGEQREIEDIHTLRARAHDESAALRAAQLQALEQRQVLMSRRAELFAAYHDQQRLEEFLASFSRGIRASRSFRGIVCPIPGGAPVSNDFGAWRPGGPHTGNDIHAPYGAPWQAVLPGTIVGLPGGWAGIGVLLRDPIGNEWLYAHGSARYVHLGEHVRQGEIIGRVGCSGNCWGPHLHFEYHPNGGAPADPYPILSRIC
jgi:murein DD-endopeptidase MepM/ murein hydrolase activator NlpD